MLALAICLILTTSALAADFGQYMGPQSYQVASSYETTTPSSYPMAYNDDFRVKPHSNIYFSFEQIRKNQPPQVDVRDEDVGRYMYRRTTTTTPAPLPSRFKDLPEISSIHSRLQEMNVASQRFSEKNIAVSTTMAPPPPPPSPKWQEFSSDFSWQPYSQYHPAPNYIAPMEHPIINHVQPRPASTTSAPMQLSEPAQDFHIRVQPVTAQYQVPRHPERNHDVVPEVGTTQSQSFLQQPLTNIRPESRHKSTYRGSHKFEWNDMTKTTELTTSVPTPVYQASTKPMSPPPPVPRLSPWHGDHF